MLRLILSTALVSALMVGAASAQTDTTTTGTVAVPGAMPNIVAPDGYAYQENTILTAQNLLAAPIYDSNGDKVGNVHDLVVATGDTNSTGTDSTTSSGTTTGSTAGTTTGTDSITGSTAGTSTDTTGSTTSTGTDSTTGAATDSTGATAGTDTTTGATTSTSTASADTAQTGQITHAIVDVGGFLGMGEHRVAIPISDLAIYSNGTDTRVYLPWTKDQMKALPSYNAEDPTTLGQSTMTPSN